MGGEDVNPVVHRIRWLRAQTLECTDPEVTVASSYLAVAVQDPWNAGLQMHVDTLGIGKDDARVPEDSLRLSGSARYTALSVMGSR